jgi:ankyrin repeat protein
MIKIHTSSPRQGETSNLRHGADVHAIDNDGKTPLHFARALRIAKALIEHGANATALDNFGRSTVDSTRTTYFPTSEERHALVFFLVENGAEPTEYDSGSDSN